MIENAVHDAQRRASREALADLTEWDYADVENPRVYADTHSGPVVGRDPAELRAALLAAVAARRSSR